MILIRGEFVRKENFLLKPSELPIRENIMFYSRSTKMASLMTLTKREAIISSSVIKGSRRTRETICILIVWIHHAKKGDLKMCFV